MAELLFAKRLLLGFFLTEVGFGASSTVNANVVQPPSDRPAGGDCFGKTLKELRAAGRVMELSARSKADGPCHCWAHALWHRAVVLRYQGLGPRASVPSALGDILR